MRASHTKTRSDKGKPRANRGPGPFWSAENRIERFCDLWESGMTTAKIAGELGTTKNAVIGMRSRLALDERLPVGPEPTTIFQRLDAMNAAMDRVLRENPVTYAAKVDKPPKTP